MLAPPTVVPPGHVLVSAQPLTDDDHRHLDALSRLIGPAGLKKLGVLTAPETFVLSVAVPVYNERHTIAAVLDKVRAAPFRKQIILVDDGSTDGTIDVLKSFPPADDLTVIFHEKNRGKGAAIRTAFAHATGDAVIIQDADLEYSPEEYPSLLEPILAGRADVVYGSRFKGEAVRVHLYWHRVANGILTLLSNFFTNLNLTDMETCYKVFRREVLQSFKLSQERFGIEPELTAKVARRRNGRSWRIYEVPIAYAGRDYSEGKKIGIRDAFKALYCIVRYAAAD